MLKGEGNMSFYAVKAGHNIGVFENWTECQSSISGFSNSVYRKFDSLEEAEAFIKDIDIYIEKVKIDISNDYLVAYTDGSFDKESKQYSFGVVIIDKELKEIAISGSSRNPDYSETNNIAGEVFGVLSALDWAVSNGYDKIKIYHDYDGLSKWISGEWKANSKISQLFLNIINSKYNGIIEIKFEHVKGHSNNRFNNKADELAANAISSRVRLPITGSNWFSIDHIESVDLEVILDIMTQEEPSIKIIKNNTSIKNTYKLELNNDKLTITSFHSGKKTLLVQGKINLLFQVFTAYIQDLLDNSTISILLSNAYRKTIDKSIVTKSYQELFSKLPTDYPENIKKLLKQSIINLNYYVESEDYSFYAFSSLRALEGHLKYVLSKGNITITSKSGFSCFNKDASNKYFLTDKGTLTLDEITYIEKIYKYYYDNRHSLFHFGDIIGATDTTRIIEDKTIIDEIINNCLELISECI